MGSTILSDLIAKVAPELVFTIAGGNVKILNNDTPKNREIVAGVIANYDTLATEYEAAQAKDAAENATKAALAAIDLKSIRSIREWLAAKDDAPQFVKDYEAAAKAERAKLAG